VLVIIRLWAIGLFVSCVSDFLVDYIYQPPEEAQTGNYCPSMGNKEARLMPTTLLTEN
jgi:hypothetical protein